MFKKITLFFILFASFVVTSYAANGRFTLVIDAGHGGHDAGAIGAISKEKDINLNIALAFGRYVERNMPDVNVIYTRKSDVFIPLHQRADIANKAKADLFVSVHTNSVASGRYVKGFQVYTLGMHRAKDNLDVAKRENSVISMEKGYQQTYQGFDPNSSESYIMFEFMQNANMERSVELARMIQNAVCSSAGRIDKGVHQAGFLVLRESYMPSCLIELGFITAADEEEHPHGRQHERISAEYYERECSSGDAEDARQMLWIVLPLFNKDHNKECGHGKRNAGCVDGQRAPDQSAERGSHDPVELVQQGDEEHEPACVDMRRYLCRVVDGE